MNQLGSIDNNNMMDDPQSMEERLRSYRSKLELAQGINNQSQANLGGASGPIWLDQEPKPKPREKRFSEYRDAAGSNPRSRVDANSGLGEINSLVKGAVDSVNKAVEMSNSKRKEPRRPVHVEESLDSLDFFKVTNLGRFNNTKE